MTDKSRTDIQRTAKEEANQLTEEEAEMLCGRGQSQDPMG